MARIVIQNLAIELGGPRRVVQVLLEELGRVAPNLPRLGAVGGRVRPCEERAHELGPLLASTINPDQPIVGLFIALVGRQNLSVGEARHVRALQLSVVPGRRISKQAIARAHGERIALDRRRDRRQHFIPERRFAFGQALNLVGQLALRGGLAERARVGQDPLVRVVELGRAEPPESRQRCARAPRLARRPRCAR